MSFEKEYAAGKERSPGADISVAATRVALQCSVPAQTKAQK